MEVGALVNSVPSDTETISVGDRTYYYSQGSYLESADSGKYEIVAPPVGATVSTLPAGAQLTTARGVAFYAAGETYYQPVYGARGGLEYTVVEKPAV